MRYPEFDTNNFTNLLRTLHPDVSISEKSLEYSPQLVAIFF